MLSSVFMLAPYYFVPQATILDYDYSTTTICSSTAICRNASSAICNTASASCDTAAAKCGTTAASCDRTAERCNTAAESYHKTSARSEKTTRWGKETRRKDLHHQDYWKTSRVGFSLQLTDCASQFICLIVSGVWSVNGVTCTDSTSLNLAKITGTAFLSNKPLSSFNHLCNTW